MPDYHVVKRSDIAGARTMFERANLEPRARLHKTGSLFLSVLAMETLSKEAVEVLIEFDQQAHTLQFSVPEALPPGITVEDCFHLQARKLKKSKRVSGVIAIKSLLDYIGFSRNGAMDFPVIRTDPEKRSITLALPAERFTLRD